MAPRKDIDRDRTLAALEAVCDRQQRELLVLRQRLSERGQGPQGVDPSATGVNQDGMASLIAENADLTAKNAELARLTLVARKTKNNVVITDRDRRIIWVNEAFERSTGYSFGEALGGSPGAILQGNVRGSAETRHMRQQFQDGGGVRMRVHNRRKDGVRRWMDIDIQPIREESSGELTGWIGVQSDVTDLVTAQAGLHAIIDGSASGIVVCDQQGVPVEVNCAAHALLGWPRVSRLSGESDADDGLAGTDAWPLHVERCSVDLHGMPPHRFTLVHGDDIDDGVFRVDRPDARPAWVLVKTRLVQGVGDWDRVVIMSVIDITGERLAHDALAASQERLALALEGARLGLFEHDLRLGTIQVDETAAGILGVSAGAVAGDLMEDWVHVDDRDALRAAYRDYLTGGTGHIDVEYRLRHCDGHWRWVHVVGRASERTGAGRVVTILAVMQDIQARKIAEIELAGADKLESVGRLASGIAHEINTPIQYISDSVHFARESVDDLLGLSAALRGIVAGADPDGAMGLVAAADDAEDDADLAYLVEHLAPSLDRALEGLGRVAELVRSMKDFAHPDQTEMAAADLNRVVTSTLAVAKNEYKYVADVVTELGDLPFVRCHGGEIGQVVLNLVVNAAHAIADLRDENRGTIRVQTRQDGDEVVIVVSDTGVGMPEHVQERIFEPFFTTKEVGRGTGQGLAISHNIICHKHGGDIDVQSEVGQGSTFTLRLPVGGPAESP